MCHVIDYSDRLDIDSPTVPLAELLLQKLQIAQTNEKDIQDTLILLREHEIGSTDKDEVNADYVAQVLSNEWGFNYTVSLNFKKIKEFLNKYPALTDEDKSVISGRIDKLQGTIDNAPKSLQWKLRAKIGPAKKWYNVVEEVNRD